jgi:GT2 family glycosyltransferase
MLPLIVPVLNRFDMFTEMMETLDYPVRLFVIDNWRGNRGVSGAWNEGMRRVLEAGYQYAVIANDDLKFTPGALQALHMDLMTKNAATISPNQRRDMRMLNKIDDRYEVDGIKAGADFFCFGVHIPELVNKVGWFDENFIPAYFEDNDMHYRMQLAGVQSLIDTDIPVFHEGSMTQKFDRNNPNTSSHRFESNRAYYIRKWGGMPTEEKYRVPFNVEGLTIRDWNGSLRRDGLETSPGQDILESFDSTSYLAPASGIHYEKL